jgi:hypothetical protein
MRIGFYLKLQFDNLARSILNQTELQVIQKKIYDIRGTKVMFDFDLDEPHQAKTRALNQAVKRNADLSPENFIFRLTKTEWNGMSSQIVKTYPTRRPKTTLPLAFTEHGVIMLANVLRSKRVEQTAVAIVWTFVDLKQFLHNYEHLEIKLEELEELCNRWFKIFIRRLTILLKKTRRKNPI